MVDVAKVIRRTIALVLGVGLLLVAGLFAGNPTMDVAKQHQQSLTAKPVEATVVDSYVVGDVGQARRLDERPSNPTRWEGGVAADTNYFVFVVFEYSVDGETYRSQNVAPPGTAALGTFAVGNRSRAERIATQYENGSTTTAYYPPGAPDRAFLRKAPTNPLWLLTVLVPASLPFVFGVLLVGGGLGLVAPDGTWKSRVGGYLVSLFMVGPITGIGAVGVLMTPGWADLPVLVLCVAMFGGVLYYTGRMMAFGKTAEEVGLL